MCQHSSACNGKFSPREISPVLRHPFSLMFSNLNPFEPFEPLKPPPPVESYRKSPCRQNHGPSLNSFGLCRGAGSSLVSPHSRSSITSGNQRHGRSTVELLFQKSSSKKKEKRKKAKMQFDHPCETPFRKLPMRKV